MPLYCFRVALTFMPSSEDLLTPDTTKIGRNPLHELTYPLTHFQFFFFSAFSFPLLLFSADVVTTFSSHLSPINLGKNLPTRR